MELNAMKTAEELRRENLELLVQQFGSLRALADKIDTNPAYLSQVRNALPESSTGKPKEIGAALARRLENATGKERGWMDHEHAQSAFVAAEACAEYRTLAEDLSTLLPEDAESFIAQIRSAADKVRRIRAIDRQEPPTRFIKRGGVRTQPRQIRTNTKVIDFQVESCARRRVS